MSSPKIKRLESLAIRHLSDIIQNEVKHPDIQFITLTATKLTSDLSHLKVFYTALNTDSSDKATVQSALEHSQAFIRTSLVHKMKMRKSPMIHFVYDESLEKGNQIAQGLKNVLNKE
jgi:ribosome-binding factor A